MPNFTKMFQEEVRRLARKEFKASLENVRREIVEARRAVSQLRKKIAAMQKENKGTAEKAVKGVLQKAAAETEEKDRARISSTTIRTMRKKLGLTQLEMGKLLNVSGQSVYQWERRGGRLRLRNATRKAILELKKLGVREARRRLEALK